MKDTNISITDERRRRAVDRVNNLPFSKLLGMRLIDIRENEAVVRIEMRDDLRQPSGVLHGGVTATIIDTAMALAVRTHLEDHEFTTTVNLTVHYLRPHKTGAVICTAKCVKVGKRMFTVSADVHDDEGMIIATGLSTYARI
jgi:uncharacterized protein (TIGR00369 family)